jgi:hypothetical protein
MNECSPRATEEGGDGRLKVSGDVAEDGDEVVVAAFREFEDLFECWCVVHILSPSKVCGERSVGRASPASGECCRLVCHDSVDFPAVWAP